MKPQLPAFTIVRCDGGDAQSGAGVVRGGSWATKLGMLVLVVGVVLGSL